MTPNVIRRDCGCVRYWLPNKATTLFCEEHQTERVAMARAGIRPPADPYKPATRWEPIKPAPGWLAMLRRAWHSLTGPTETADEMLTTAVRGDGTACREHGEDA